MYSGDDMSQTVLNGAFFIGQMRIFLGTYVPRQHMRGGVFVFLVDSFSAVNFSVETASSECHLVAVRLTLILTASVETTARSQRYTISCLTPHGLLERTPKNYEFTHSKDVDACRVTPARVLAWLQQCQGTRVPAKLQSLAGEIPPVDGVPSFT